MDGFKQMGEMSYFSLQVFGLVLLFFVVGGRHCIVKAKAKYQARSVAVTLG